MIPFHIEANMKMSRFICPHLSNSSQVLIFYVNFICNLMSNESSATGARKKMLAKDNEYCNFAVIFSKRVAHTPRARFYMEMGTKTIPLCRTIVPSSMITQRSVTFDDTYTILIYLQNDNNINKNKYFVRVSLASLLFLRSSTHLNNPISAP